MNSVSIRSLSRTAVPVLVRALAGVALAMSATTTVTADERSDAQQLVDGAATTINNFRADPNMTWFRKHIPNARGVLVVPQLLKAGFIFGGSGGGGVLLGRQGNKWSMPAFYNMGSVTFGLQIGAEVAEVVLLIMTDRGMDAMYSTEFKLGADVSVAAGPVGAGATAATADVLAFSRSKGVFGGLTLEGAIIKPREATNAAYYGAPLRPLEIINGKGSNPGVAGLHAALGGGAPAAHAAKAAPAADYDLRTIQESLKAKGYDPGTPDGRLGPNTEKAIRDYQSTNGLKVDGQPSLALQRHLAS